MKMRIPCLLAAALALAACSGGSHTAFVPDSPAAARSAASAAGSGTLVIRAVRHLRGHYVSASTQGMSVQITGPTNLTQNVGLTVTARGCASSLMTLACSLSIPGLKACPTPKACYTATIKTYDAFNAGTGKIPPTAHKLSADTLGFTVGSAATTIVPVVLEGLPKSVAFIPSAGTNLTGNATAGFVEPKCSASAQTVTVLGVDADGNYILGPGEPSVALVSSNPAQLGVRRVLPLSRSTFRLAPPHAPNYAYGGYTIKLTATVTPGAQSGGTVVSKVVDVSYSGDICGIFTEFPLAAANSHPWAITAGPDGNVWFTEYVGNNVGRVTPSGTVGEYPLLTANAEPVGITSGPDGNVWFTEQGVAKIGKVTTAGVVATEYPTVTAASQPANIVTGPDGNLWFTEAGADNVAKITTTGVVTEFPVITAGAQPYGITVGPDHNLWFTEISASKIGVTTTAGTVSEYGTPTAASHPATIVSGSNGNLWFAECTANNMGEIRPSGSFVAEFALPEPGSNAVFVTEGPDGAVYFSEATQNRIARAGLDGTYTEYAIPTGGSEPFGITRGPDGSIWFAELLGNKIGRLR